MNSRPTTDEALEKPNVSDTVHGRPLVVQAFVEPKPPCVATRKPSIVPRSVIVSTAGLSLVKPLISSVGWLVWPTRS